MIWSEKELFSQDFSNSMETSYILYILYILYPISHLSYILYVVYLSHHADAVPGVHSCQVGHHRQVGAEPASSKSGIINWFYFISSFTRCSLWRNWALLWRQALPCNLTNICCEPFLIDFLKFFYHCWNKMWLRVKSVRTLQGQRSSPARMRGRTKWLGWFLKSFVLIHGKIHNYMHEHP